MRNMRLVFSPGPSASLSGSSAEGGLPCFEHEYSRDRLNSLADEWFADYPNLLHCTKILKGRNATFRVEEITADHVLDFGVDLLGGSLDHKDMISEATQSVFDAILSSFALTTIILQILYRVGLVGPKLEPHEAAVWSIMGRRTVTAVEISPKTVVAIHPCYWRVLGIRPL
jgi:hypothetical protein